MNQNCNYIKPVKSLDQQCKDYYGVDYLWNNAASRCITLVAPQPSCSADTWSCGDWGSCSLSGVQGRSCRKTFDCSAVEDGAPATSRSCTPPEIYPQQTTDQIGSINREQIFRATVKLKCPTPDRKFYSQGSGTVIDQYGTILTNRHVVLNTIGSCEVGFINDENDIPNFSEIADVKNVSSDQSSNGDMALLKIRNYGNKSFTAVDILKGNSDTLKSGDTILPFGYPDENLFGETITSTEGPYSGKGTTIKFTGEYYDCNKRTSGKIQYPVADDVRGFFKTTATLDHGNSGGGAYQKKTGFFMGIPTLGTSLDCRIPSRVNYILSVNTIKGWLDSFGSYNISGNNYSNLGNYLNSPIKIEDVNLSTLRALDAPTPIEIISGKTEEKSKSQKVAAVPTSPKINEPQKESTIIEPTDTNQKISLEQNNQNSAPPVVNPQQKASLVKRFVNWLTNFFR